MLLGGRGKECASKNFTQAALAAPPPHISGLLAGRASRPGWATC